MKHLKRLTAIIICAFMTLSLTAVFVPFVSKAAEASYSQGDIIEFGSYPQTLVTDEALIEELSWYIEDDMWQSLGWYKGTGSYGTMYETDDGKYCDIEYMGEKYRAYTYTHNRAVNTFSKPLSIDEPQIYFFKFEPIQWVLLDADTGLMMSKDILDSQAFSNTVYRTQNDEGTWEYYCDEEMTSYCSTWNTSSLRTYLNDTFYSTAFNSAEQNLIKETELSNEVVSGGYDYCGGENTIDKVFVQSYIEAAKLLSDTAIKQYWEKSGTDYAQAQGLYTPSSSEYSLYWLRSAYTTKTATQISEKGMVSKGGDVYATDWGVAPTMQIDLTALDEADLYKNITVEFNDGVLTVSGSGTLPDRTASVTDILASYAEITTAVIIEDGITEIAENAFDGFIEMKTLILEGDTVLQDNSLPDSFQLSTVIIKDTVTFNGNPFAPDIYYVNVFKSESAEFTYESLPEGVSVYTYSYQNGNTDVTGSVTMNTYEFFDFMAVMCDEFENIETVSFDSFTSTDLQFYTYDSTTEARTMIPDSVITNAVFSVEISTDNSAEKVTFNTLCDMAADGTLDEFFLITSSDTTGEIEDTEMEINTLEDLITYALKWIVSLMNFFFSLFSRFR